VVAPSPFCRLLCAFLVVTLAASLPTVDCNWTRYQLRFSWLIQHQTFKLADIWILGSDFLHIIGHGSSTSVLHTVRQRPSRRQGHRTYDRLLCDSRRWCKVPVFPHLDMSCANQGLVRSSAGQHHCSAAVAQLRRARGTPLLNHRMKSSTKTMHSVAMTPMRAGEAVSDCFPI
jgi:hypothetical protein